MKVVASGQRPLQAGDSLVVLELVAACYRHADCRDGPAGGRTC